MGVCFSIVISYFTIRFLEKEIKMKVSGEQIKKIETVIRKSEDLTTLAQKVIVMMLRVSVNLTNQVYINFPLGVGLSIATQILSFRHRDETINTLLMETKSSMKFFVVLDKKSVGIALGVLDFSPNYTKVLISIPEVRCFKID